MQKQQVVVRERKKKQRCWMSWQTVYDATPASQFLLPNEPSLLWCLFLIENLFPLVETLQQMALLSCFSSKNEASLAFHFNPTTLLTVQLGPEGSSQIGWELTLLFSSGHSYEEFPDKGTIVDDTKGACLVISRRRWWTQPSSHSSQSSTIQFPCENKELMESTALNCNYV